MEVWDRGVQPSSPLEGPHSEGHPGFKVEQPDAAPGTCKGLPPPLPYSTLRPAVNVSRRRGPATRGAGRGEGEG